MMKSLSLLFIFSFSFLSSEVLRAGERRSFDDPSCFKQSKVIIAHLDEVRTLAFSPDSKILATGAIGDNGTFIELWDIPSGNHIRSLNGHTLGVRSVCFSKDGKTLASGGWDDSAILWDPASGRQLQVFVGHKADIRSVSLSPNGEMLASSGGDGTIRFWDVASGKEIHTIIQERFVQAISFSPNGKTLASSVDDGYGHYSAKIWDVLTLKEILTLPGTPPLCFSPDGKILAIGSNSYNIKLWDSSSGKEVRLLKMGQFYIRSISFSPNGKWLAAADGMNIYVWEVSSGHLVRTLKNNKIDDRWVVSFSPNGRWLAAGGCAEMPDQDCIKGAIMLWSCEE